MKKLFFCFLAGVFSCFAKQPNIILILTDDQGYGDVQAHGHPYLKTPNMNKLRLEGVSFDNFYVSPSCSPTRAALLTGMHEFRNGVTHTIVPRQQLHKEAIILPETLSLRVTFQHSLGNGILEIILAQSKEDSNGAQPIKLVH